MRELWIGAVDQLSEAQKELLAAGTRIAELEKSEKLKKKGEERSHNDKGERVFKSELALAVRHLVITGMSQKEIAELLGLNSNDVSQLKKRGTKLHQQRAKL